MVQECGGPASEPVSGWKRPLTARQENTLQSDIEVKGKIRHQVVVRLITILVETGGLPGECLLQRRRAESDHGGEYGGGGGRDRLVLIDGKELPVAERAALGRKAEAKYLDLR